MKYRLEPALTKGEKIAGLIYLPFYFILIELALAFCFSFFQISISDQWYNLLYAFINFILVVIIFRKFLKESLSGFTGAFWKSVQAILLGFALYYALNIIMSILLDGLFGSVDNPNDSNIYDLVDIDPRTVIAWAVLLGPLTEEMVFRGIIFGLLHPKNRILAYVVMCLTFSALHVWPYALSGFSWVYLVNLLQYLPGAIALGWCYEKSGTIWCSVFLHMLMNGITLYSYIQFF